LKTSTTLILSTDFHVTSVVPAAFFVTVSVAPEAVAANFASRPLWMIGSLNDSRAMMSAVAVSQTGVPAATASLTSSGLQTFY
jgi:hypothetical protein